MARFQIGRYTRYLVVGDRDWPKEGYPVIKKQLSLLSPDSLIIVSEAQGADLQADIAAHLLGFRIVKVKLEEEKYGSYAEFVRNIRMFEQYKPHHVLAFTTGRGTNKNLQHIIKLASKRNVRIRSFSSDAVSSMSGKLS